MVEADEYDRSFLKLKPDIAVITSVDPDHLDIYKNKENLINNTKVEPTTYKKGIYQIIFKRNYISRCFKLVKL